MKKIFFCILILTTVCSFACKTSKKSATAGSIKENTATRDFEKEGFSKAIMIDYSGISGCGFLIQLENDQKLQPKNLPDEFKKENLEVWVKYVVEDVPNVCMTGKVTRIVEIQKRVK